MKPLSIRLKLTAWYIAILLASLSIFSVAAFFAMNGYISISFLLFWGVATALWKV